MKSLSSVPTRVKGIHRTPSRRSDTARLSRNTFVIVLILWLWTSVSITRELPATASRKIVAYSGIWMRPYGAFSHHFWWDCAGMSVVLYNVVLKNSVVLYTSVTSITFRFQFTHGFKLDYITRSLHFSKKLKFIYWIAVFSKAFFNPR